MKTKINADLYEFFSRNVPKLPGESDDSWKDRIKRSPDLVEMQIRKAPFAEQIKLVAMRRALAVAGAKRTATGVAGHNNADSMAKLYQEKYFATAEMRKKFAVDMINFLDKAFEYGSPVDGSIFWTGVDENKLVKQVAIWNSEFKGELMFGQLEATTDARYINGGVAWEAEGAPFQASQMYFGQVSGRYGALAKGHVTVVQLYGLRNDSIFTTKEFPTLLKHMADAISKGQTPAVQDITVVVLDPLNCNEPYKAYTNSEIFDVAIMYKSPKCTTKYMQSKNDAAIEKQLSSIIPVKVKAYWYQRGKKPVSKAALKIMADYQLIKR